MCAGSVPVSTVLCSGASDKEYHRAMVRDGLFAQGAAHLGDGVLCREPPMDALMMELMVAQWQYRNPLLRLQGAKADAALDGVALISIDVWEWRVVREHRETEEDGGGRVEGDIANLAWRVVAHPVNPEDGYEDVDAGE